MTIAAQAAQQQIMEFAFKRWERRAVVRPNSRTPDRALSRLVQSESVLHVLLLDSSGRLIGIFDAVAHCFII
jgi:hypothetical protein